MGGDTAESAGRLTLPGRRRPPDHRGDREGQLPRPHRQGRPDARPLSRCRPDGPPTSSRRGWPRSSADRSSPRAAPHPATRLGGQPGPGVPRHEGPDRRPLEVIAHEPHRRPEPSAMTGPQQSTPDAESRPPTSRSGPLPSAPSAWSGSWAWSTRTRSTSPRVPTSCWPWPTRRATTRTLGRREPAPP